MDRTLRRLTCSRSSKLRRLAGDDAQHRSVVLPADCRLVRSQGLGGFVHDGSGPRTLAESDEGAIHRAGRHVAGTPPSPSGQTVPHALCSSAHQAAFGLHERPPLKATAPPLYSTSDRDRRPGSSLSVGGSYVSTTASDDASANWGTDWGVGCSRRCRRSSPQTRFSAGTVNWSRGNGPTEARAMTTN